MFIKYKPSSKIEFPILITLMIYTISQFFSPFISQITPSYLDLIVLLIIYLIVITFITLDTLKFLLLTFIPFILDILFFRDELSLSIEFFYGLFLNISPIIIFVFMYKYFNKFERGRFGNALSILIGITCVTTSFALLKSPEISRVLATISSSDSELLIRYNYLNVGGYTFVYSILTLIPVYYYLIRKNKLNVLFIILLFITILLSQYTIAFLLALVIIGLLIFIYNDKKRLLSVILIALFLVSLSIFTPFILAILIDLSEHMNSQFMIERLQQALDIYNGEIRIFENERLSLYFMSIKTFLNNPFLGSLFTNNGVGQHSFVLDTMGKYGIIGISYLYMYYRILYVNTVGKIKVKKARSYLKLSFVIFIIIGILNPYSSLATIGFILPLLISSVDKEEN